MHILQNTARRLLVQLGGALPVGLPERRVPGRQVPAQGLPGRAEESMKTQKKLMCGGSFHDPTRCNPARLQCRQHIVGVDSGFRIVKVSTWLLRVITANSQTKIPQQRLGHLKIPIIRIISTKS